MVIELFTILFMDFIQQTWNSMQITDTDLRAHMAIRFIDSCSIMNGSCLKSLYLLLGLFHFNFTDIYRLMCPGGRREIAVKVMS